MDEGSNILAEAEKRVGATLRGKYTIDKLLGVGGMAAVYRAVHRNGHRVALKMLHASISSNTDLRGRFLREGYVANAVDHPGAVRVTDDDVADDGSVFLVMELLEGETLDALFERAGRLPPRDLAIIAWHLLDVLEAAHAKGVVHRDIKPDNLFITHGGVLKILDFGIARLVDSFTSATATHTGSMVGTPAFMAPEQALGRSREIDGRTDLWSVGATMFLLASSQYVHEADTVGAMVVYAGSQHARTVNSVAPEFPVPLAAVIDRALAFDKTLRYPGASAMKRAIEDAFVTCFGSPIPTGPMGSTFPATAPRANLPGASEALAPTMQSGAALIPSPSQPRALAAAQTATSTAGVASSGTTRTKGTPVAALAVGVAVALAGAVGLGAFVMRRAQPSTSSTATTGATTAASTPVTSAPPPVVTLVTSALAPPAIVVGGAPTDSKTVEPKPTAAVVAQPVHGATTKVAAAKSIAPPPATAAPAPTAPHVDCEPPYTIDAQGHRIPKPGCY